MTLCKQLHMTRFELRAAWVFGRGKDDARSLDEVIELLTVIEQENNLSRACRKLDVSYRHAWGLLRDASRILGGPLVHSVRGQGVTLSKLGERLVWANKRVRARLSPVLANLASELEGELRQALPVQTAPIRIHASHSFAMDTLRDELREHGVASEVR